MKTSSADRDCIDVTGQALISAQPQERAQPGPIVEAMNRVRVKGKAEPVDLLDVIGLAKDQSMTVPRREIRKNIRAELSADLFFPVLPDKTVSPRDSSRHDPGSEQQWPIFNQPNQT